MTAADLPKIPQFDALKWENVEDSGSWHLRDGLDLVGEVFERSEGMWYWHCKTSDWRQCADTAEEAKLRCLVSHVRELMFRFTDQRVTAMVARAECTRAHWNGKT